MEIRVLSKLLRNLICTFIPSVMSGTKNGLVQNLINFLMLLNAFFKHTRNISSTADNILNNKSLECKTEIVSCYGAGISL